MHSHYIFETLSLRRFWVSKTFPKGEVTLSSVIYFWLFGVHVCVLFVYTTFISTLCVPQEEFSLIKSNQQICGFYKDSVEISEIKFWYQQLFTQWNTKSCREHIAGGFNIYLYGWVSLLALVCFVCLCMCDTKSEY